MAMKREQVLAEALALPTDERAKLVSKLLASLPASADKPRSLLDLAGRGAGVWGDDSTATLERQRDEWH
jgi:hypothetical protein